MIKEIKIKQFYSFQDSTIKLNPNTNIIIGINASGKSNFLKALKLLKEGVTGAGLRTLIYDKWGGFDNLFFKGEYDNEIPRSIEIEYTLDGKIVTKIGGGMNFREDIIYTIKIIFQPNMANYYVVEKIETAGHFLYLDFTKGKGRLNQKVGENYNTKFVPYNDFDEQELVLKEINDTDTYFSLTTIKKAIKEIMVYDYFDTTPTSLIRKPMLPTSGKKLSADGTNLPQILNTLNINHKRDYYKIIEMLKSINPNIEGCDFNMIGGNIELLLSEKNLGSSIHVSSISDGTLRYLCLLAILYNPERGKLICIDEPEVGLHPDMIMNIADAIKVASATSMIIISTHSELLLDFFELENVRVFEKNSSNATEVICFSDADFEDWYETFSLGKMWRNGDLGGVR